MRWIIVTGLPATGKSTLATVLAARYALPLLAKDAFKEQLLRTSLPVDSRQSRELSNRSFANLFAQADQLAHAGRDALLEGNFRAGDPARHAGHADARAMRDASNDAFLDLPGARLILTAGTAALVTELDRWWQADTVR